MPLDFLINHGSSNLFYRTCCVVDMHASPNGVLIGMCNVSFANCTCVYVLLGFARKVPEAVSAV